MQRRAIFVIPIFVWAMMGRPAPTIEKEQGLRAVVAGEVQSPDSFARDSVDEADTLYTQRENLASARRAAAIWVARLKRHPRDFDAAWKLARACYWLGAHVLPNERERVWENGIQAAHSAVAADPNRAEGHFWLAANMGARSEGDLFAGLAYHDTIRLELETLLKLNPAYLGGSADRALGRWYSRVPALLGGSLS